MGDLGAGRGGSPELAGGGLPEFGRDEEVDGSGHQVRKRCSTGSPSPSPPRVCSDLVVRTVPRGSCCGSRRWSPLFSLDMPPPPCRSPPRPAAASCHALDLAEEELGEEREGKSGRSVDGGAPTMGLDDHALLLSHGGRRRSGRGGLLLTLLLWIPVIFQDNLAQIAVSHLQENDLVYVSGQLTGHVLPFKHTDVQANIQVIANLLLFVDGKAVERNVMLDEEEGLMEIAEAEKKVAQTKPISKYPARTFTHARRWFMILVMEQQPASFVKAGIIASLNARTSVLPCANPSESHYNSRLYVIDSIHLPRTLLSRFDPVFLILEEGVTFWWR